MTGLSGVLLAIALAIQSPLLMASQAFTVKDIRVEGLQRISAGTVFNYLPVKVGDEIGSAETASAIRALFRTGFFKDIRVEREGNTFVVSVVERPSIDTIEFAGNEAIETEQLLEALKQVGFAPGSSFNRAAFERTKLQLHEAYFARGRYAVRVTETVTPLPRNRVSIRFDISEGRVAKIKRINIVGNADFDESDLLGLFKLTTPNWLSWFSDSDQYSKQRLSADLEALRAHYLDRGYINFVVDSTQVSLTPDKGFVYVTINITEGDQYLVRDIKLAGDLAVNKEELFPLFTVRKDGIFSRREVQETTSKLTRRLGDEGYAFANVNALPEIDESEKSVDLTFFTDPGKRVYVRRIIFRGNTKSRDGVLRREMRQMEGGWISTGRLERSRTRLRRLGFFEEITIETPSVPGTTDMVDVVVSVKEKSSGSFMAGVGYSGSQGAVFNTSLDQENFLGTGNKLNFSFNNTEVNRTFGGSFTNPYWTLDGVSRQISVAYRETDASDANLADYSTASFEGGSEFGIPINETDRVHVGVTADVTDFTAGASASNEVREFDSANPDGYFTWRINSRWSRDSRNRRILPDSGSLTRATGEIALPGGDLTYYRLGVEHRQFIPLGSLFAFIAHGKANYGDGYGDTTELPLVNNYFAGGIRSVRGFEANTLGPRDSNNKPLGGALHVAGGGELVLPVPFMTDKRSVRVTAFVDGGNVFKDIGSFDAGEIRFSTGVSAIWLSPFGALTFSLAHPLNAEDGDETEAFQFTLGTNF